MTIGLIIILGELILFIAIILLYLRITRLEDLIIGDALDTMAAEVAQTIFTDPPPGSPQHN